MSTLSPFLIPNRYNELTTDIQFEISRLIDMLACWPSNRDPLITEDLVPFIAALSEKLALTILTMPDDESDSDNYI